MNRYCEVKLTDVLQPEMSTKRSKSATDLKNLSTKNRCTKTKLGNLSFLKNKPDKLCDETRTTSLGESRKTKLTKKSSTPTNSNQANKNQDDDVGIVAVLKPEHSIGKRKRVENKIGNVAEYSSKKICIDKNSLTVPSRNVSSNPDQKITQRRKRKKKSRESCWENKLTGAKRVSKRLSNLRIKKKKSLKNLGPLVNAAHALIKSKQPVTFSARGKIKASDDVYKKSNKRVKPSYKKNRQEVQINFGKLSHTMRLYPKISAGRNRRPATYTVTIKPTGSFQQSSENRTTCSEYFTETDTDEESSEPDVNSLISKCVEDVQDVIVGETPKDPESNCGIIEDKDKDKSNDNSQFNETSVENCFEEITQENDVQTLLCGSVAEYDDGSTIVIVDIESGESIECQSEETDKEENTEFDQSNEEISPAENQSNLEDTSEAAEVISVINFKASKTEEKFKSDNSNYSKTNMPDTNLKTEIKEKENTKIVGGLKESLTTEVIDITNTTVEVEK